jgi:hypothetical protein
VTASYAVSGPTGVKVTPDKLTPAPPGAADDWKNRFRRNLVVAARSGEGPFTHPLQTSSIVQCEAAAR